MSYPNQIFQKIIDDTENVFKTEEKNKTRHFDGFTKALENRNSIIIENMKLNLYEKEKDTMYDPYNCESDIGSLLDPVLEPSDWSEPF